MAKAGADVASRSGAPKPKSEKDALLSAANSKLKLKPKPTAADGADPKAKAAKAKRPLDDGADAAAKPKGLGAEAKRPKLVPTAAEGAGRLRAASGPAPAAAAPKVKRADDDDDGDDDDGAVDGAGAFVFEEDDEGSDDEPLDMAVRACASADKSKPTHSARRLAARFATRGRPVAAWHSLLRRSGGLPATPEALLRSSQNGTGLRRGRIRCECRSPSTGYDARCAKRRPACG